MKVEVVLGERAIPVGTLTTFSDGRRQTSNFRYAESWRAEGFPICPGMPLAQEQFYNSGQGTPCSSFCGPLADTCPDAWGQQIILRDQLRSARRGPVGDVDFLVGVDDLARQGALRLRDESGRYLRALEQGRPIAPALIELEELLRAAHAVEAHTETDRDLARLRGTGSSIGGARPKCTVLDEDGSLLIAKFPSRGEGLPVEKAEVTALELARRCGISASEARLLVLKPKGKPHEAIALIRRFDRHGRQRIPYISAQTMLGAASAEGATYTEMAESIRRFCVDSPRNNCELFSRVVFTILVSSGDDHLRNHGFLHVRDGRWALAPLFDVNPSPHRSPGLKTWISEVSGDAASLEAAIQAAPFFGLSADQAVERIVSISRIIKEQWQQVASEVGSMTKRELQIYAPAFEHEQSAFAHRLGKAAAKVAPGPKAKRKSMPPQLDEGEEDSQGATL